RQMVIAIILDISDRKNYTHKLEKTVEQRTEQLKKALETEKELNELKTKFLSLVSHEFKTPLSGILTSATLVGKYTKEDQQEKRDKHLKTIIGGVHHLNHILNDFLSMESLEKGKEVYRYSNFSLSKLVNKVIYNANMMLKSGQHINYPRNIDDVHINQEEKIADLVLTNLLNNAVKYSREDTEIDLKVDLMTDKIVFHIKDSGIGIPKKDQKYIFDRYFRAENVLTTQGTGIGLNIVKAHVENLGGKIGFKSTENKGSAFTVELPLKI
ncbi:MAG: HAMP domain-containing sensor histidine kinase, partial [Pricia sp.]